VLPAPVAERRARLVLAGRFAERGMQGLARDLTAQAGPEPAAAERGARGRIVLTSYGFNDPGGGTVIPRLASRALAARGWDVTVFHAAVQPLPGAGAYAVREWEEDGVRLVGVFNRPHGLLDLGHPRRELDDPAIARAFGELLDRVRPDVVHYHNLHNLGLSLVDETFARGIRSCFTPHNLWLVCARNHLMREGGVLCDGPGADGANCAPCTGTRDAAGYAARRVEMFERVAGRVGQVQAVSGFVADMLVDGGLPREMVTVLPLGAPSAAAIWDAVGRNRGPRDRERPLTVGFVGAGVWHKGAFTFASAAAQVTGDVRFVLHGSVTDADRARFAQVDPAGRVELAGGYAHADLPDVLAGIDVAVVPSAVWEGAPLTVGECRAARLPVIASRMGGLAEGVRDGVDGLLVDGWSDEALAGAIQRLADRPYLVDAMGAAIPAPRTFADYVDDLEEAYAAGAAPHVEPPTPLAVRWRGDFDAISSLARINGEVVRRLGDGFVVDVAADDRPARTSAPPRPAAVEVRHQWPPVFEDPGLGRLVLIQPWEFGSIPRDWLEPLAGVDEVWVPSAYVRDMYVGDGVPADRVHVVPNGVDLDVYRPDGPARRLADDRVCTFLFVGGTIYRKGIDVLLQAFEEAFAGRDDVLLVIKDVGAGTFYSGMNVADELRRRQAAGAPIEVLADDLDDAGLAALYRGCDVLVHPYRGEGFAMPVLEAMACGRPVLVTGGGPTDEFCPADASWRIPARREPVAPVLLGDLQAASEAWMLEPDRDALVRLLREAAADHEGRQARGTAARTAAEGYGLDAIAAQYAARLRAVAARPVRRSQPVLEPFALPDARGTNFLATPAWLGDDRLTELLAAWRAAFTEADDVALYLLADPSRDGDAEARERRVLDAFDVNGADGIADVALLEHVAFGADLARIHAACDAYVPLHPACDGHARLARVAGSAVLPPDAAALRGVHDRARRAAA
jgi:glycosyltransferase involved in cell wall biosynthesis